MVRLKNASGKHYTKQLFYEIWNNLDINNRVGEQPPFTLYVDKPGMVNFGKAYIETEDPSGYKITQKLLGGDYKHWMALLKCTWFLESKEVWDKELEARLYSRGLEAIKEIAMDENHKGRLQAARLLVDKSYSTSKMDSKASRGRPTKEEVQGHIREAVHAEKALQDDLERIRSVG